MTKTALIAAIFSLTAIAPPASAAEFGIAPATSELRAMIAPSGTNFDIGPVVEYEQNYDDDGRHDDDYYDDDRSGHRVRHDRYDRYDRRDRYDRHDRRGRYDRHDRYVRYDRNGRRIYSREVIYDQRGRYVNPRRVSRDRVWRGRDGQYYCQRDNGTTGLVIGAGVGALLGRSIDTRGDRTAGTLLGALAGGLLGREIDRGELRCR